MSAPRASTTARGYGSPHQQARQRYLARYRPGDPCTRCGQPLPRDTSLIDLGHNDTRTGWTGLEHRACNRRAGAINGNRARGNQPPKPVRRTSVWD